MTTLTVRPISPEDQARWRELWQSYLDFYEQDLSENVTQTVWSRLMNPDHHLCGLVAVDGENNTVIGFTHYFFHISTWNVTSYCYLEDLYVDETIRGKGAGRALIQGVVDAARAVGSTKVYWFTNKENEQAQALYNKVAELTGFLRYDVKL